jgi:methylenetetrahydrofolate dehydrogenase (NADP+)/methenyltetrahydrofolate cyclohydrolase
MILVDGKQIAEEIYTALASEIASVRALGIHPGLAVVLVGDDPNSRIYVAAKQRHASKLGIAFELKYFHDNAKDSDILKSLAELSQNQSIHGIIVQMPLPEGHDTELILKALDEEKDVDNLTGKSKFIAPTPQSVLKILDHYKIKFGDKRTLLVGNGRLVGRPLSRILSSKGINHDMVDVTETDLAKKTLEADIIITATGQDGIIHQDMVKEGVVVIDASRDVDFESVCTKASLITPPKGGLGPVTVAYLLTNVVRAAKIQTDL